MTSKQTDQGTVTGDDTETRPLLRSRSVEIIIRHGLARNFSSPLCFRSSVDFSSDESGEQGRNADHEPFTYGPLFAILFMGVVQPMCFELIFPFINQMIVENGITNDPERVGFYSGLIESIFQVMSFLAVLPCSYVSDHLGRKPVVLFGTAGMALSISLFGVSKSYVMMILTRCIGGTLGGTWSALKVMMAEIYTNKSHRATAFSTFQIAFRTGQIVGQPLGGLLSHPSRTMPVFDRSFWRNYPFSLPCFIAAAIAGLSVIWAYFALDETLPSRKVGRSHKAIPSDSQSGSQESTRETAENQRSQNASVRSVLTPHVMSVLASIFVMTLVSEVLFALYPLFAFTPITSGGLGLSEPQIGAHMATRSAMNIFVLFAYAPFASRLGAVRVYQVGMALWPLATAILPLLNALARSDNMGVGSLLFNVTLLLFFALWSLGNLVWPSSQIVVIEAASTPEALARVNGLAQMVQTFTMAIAPATITTLFAYSIKNRIIGGNLTYIAMLVLACAGSFHSLTLREPTKVAGSA
ncbi:MFS general substrate transporter [Fomitiporia mediterranea MF3/22]|uniref:MFS general substrate transporter n=1 Tax=Fomitiporia mediterranea (strain MF3/22) TaxID=694068 RepID=UPI0004408BBC|nr:MFS general substrate transporter [Fomitiporia mediterranea MF3/22]EJD05642.1 MFS general substrate transporter [Fomitiporia mediterranea MF3/22]